MRKILTAVILTFLFAPFSEAAKKEKYDDSFSAQFRVVESSAFTNLIFGSSEDKFSKEPKMFVARTEKEATKKFKKMTGHDFEKGLVDFEKEVAVVLFYGFVPSGGWHIKIDEVKRHIYYQKSEDNSEIGSTRQKRIQIYASYAVIVKTTVKQPEGVITQSIGWPFAIIAVSKKIEKNFSFENDLPSPIFRWLNTDIKHWWLGAN